MAEIAALYLNTKYSVIIHNTLEEMEHPHLAMPLHTNNSTVEVIVNRTIVQIFYKSMDISFYWLRNQENQKRFQFYWATSSQNLGGCHIKHHQSEHHRVVRDIYLYRKANKSKERESREVELIQQVPRPHMRMCCSLKHLKIT